MEAAAVVEVVGGSGGSDVTVLGRATEWEGRYDNLVPNLTLHPPLLDALEGDRG